MVLTALWRMMISIFGVAVNFGSAICHVREAASPTGLLMSFKLRALGFLADAERALEDRSSCLARDVIVSEAQATEHNRSFVNARNALYALSGQISGEHEDVCRHLRDAQMTFLQSKPLISFATGYTGCDTNFERELALSALLYERNESEDVQSEEVGPAVAQGTQMPFVSSSSRSQQRELQTDSGSIEDAHRSVRQVNSSLNSALHDDDNETVNGFSDDGHSYAGTIVRGVLRGDSE